MAKRMTEEEVKDLHINQRIVQWAYPWDEWLDGDWWLIERGTDYHIKTKSMQKLIHDKKKSWEGRMITHRLPKDTILFRRRPNAGNT